MKTLSAGGGSPEKRGRKHIYSRSTTPGQEVATVTRRFNELKKTAISMLQEGKTDLPEKIIDSMIDIVRDKEKSYVKGRKKALEKRFKRMLEEAEKEAHEKYQAKETTLKIIQLHIKKEEFQEANALLRGFYLTRKSKRRRIRKEDKPSPDSEAEDKAVKDALEEEVEGDVFQELADLMSIGEEEARMYSLELAEGFKKATKREIGVEKAAECYLRFRNWDFKTTWLPAIKQTKD